MSARIHRTPLVVAATSMTLMFGSLAAVAQPHGHGPHGHRGMHGANVEQVIADLKGKLALNSSQQVMFDNAVASTKAARQAGRAEMQRVREAMRVELAKAEPDLAAIATVTDDVHAKGQALRRQVRDEWLKLYATFTPTQKQVVRDTLSEKMARFESFREKMKERRGTQG